MYGDMGGYSDAVGAALGGGASQSGADAHDSSNMGEYGFGDSPISYSDNINFNSVADALASALGLGKPAKQTDTFPAGQSMAPKTSSPFSLASITPGRFGASLLAAITGGSPPRGIMTPDTHNFMQQNQFMEQDPSLYSEFPEYIGEGPMEIGGPSRRGLISAVMAGSGPQLGLASGFEDIGGVNLPVGPPLSLDPGQFNPVNNMQFQGGAENPYVRKPRNIAQMIGV